MSPTMPKARVPQPERSFLRAGIVISVLLHLGSAFLINAQRPTTIAEPVVINVVYEQHEPVPTRQRQIVSPSTTDNQTPPKETALLSERDSTVAKEQIKRGEHENAATTPPSPRATKNTPASPARKHNQPLDKAQPQPRSTSPQLKLSDPALIDKLGALPAASEKPSEASKSPSEYAAFSRPSGSGAQFLGVPGTTDYLPNLPDGDITLLNAKAERFAVFVRRVATQVFAQLRIEGWDQLSPGDIRRISEFSTVRAVLSPKGQLLKVVLEEESGSARFDEVLLRAVRKAARDPHPPPAAAASDGNYHFIFQSKSWSRTVTAARSGAPMEQRWLLLATGLD